MIHVLAHVGGVPVEELLVPFASGACAVGAGVLLARAWVLSHVGRPRESRDDRERSDVI